MDIQKEYASLMEAYNAVYENQEQVEENEIEEGFRKIPAGRQREAMMKRAKTLTKKAMAYAGSEGEAAGDDRIKMGKINAALRDPKLREEVETDLFDIILEHLVAEGYADTNEAALAIMANMSEEWKQDIMEISDKKVIAARNALAKRTDKANARNDGNAYSRNVSREARMNARIQSRNQRTGSNVEPTFTRRHQ